MVKWKDYYYKGTFELKIPALNDIEAGKKRECAISEIEKTKNLTVTSCSLSMKVYGTGGN